MHPLAIVQITSVIFPITVFRDEEFRNSLKPRRAESSRPTIRCPSFAQSQRLPPRGSCHEVTEGVPPPAGDGRNCNDCNLYDDSRVFPNRRRWCKIQDTTRQLRCHPPRGGGQTVNLPATMSWIDIVARKAPAFKKTEGLNRRS